MEKGTKNGTSVSTIECMNERCDKCIVVAFTALRVSYDATRYATRASFQERRLLYEELLCLPFALLKLAAYGYVFFVMSE